MKTSFQLIAFGVGVWMTVGATGASYAQSVGGQPQDDPDVSLPNFPSHALATSHSLRLTNAKQAKVTTASRFKPAKSVNPTSLKLGAQTIPVHAFKSIASIGSTRKSDPVTRTQNRRPTPLTAKTPRSKFIAQTPSTTVPSAPLPTTSPFSTPAPSSAPTGTTAPAPTTPVPTGNFLPSQPGKPPAYLNPSPNLLQFPTRPTEVQVRATQQITLQQALELAERNNRDIQTARLQVEQTRAAVREARAGNFPTLAITADLTRSGNSAFISQPDRSDTLSQLLGLSPTSGNVTSTSFTTGAQLNYDLYTSGLRPAQIRAAERQSRTSELQLEQTREAVRLQVTTDYYNLQNADQQVIINDAAVRNAAANLRDAQAQERAGLGTRFDVLRAEVNLANSQQQLTNAVANQTVQRRQLAQRLSISEAVNLAADTVVQQAGTWTLSLEDSIVLAYKNRAELETQLVQRDLSQEQIRAARAANGPTLSFVASYQFQRSGSTTTDTANSDGYSLGLRAQWSLFDGGATNARIAQREREKEIAEVRFAQARNQVRFDVEQAYANLEANLANIATTERAVTQAEEALRLAILRFQAGVGTQTDRINAETDLTRARGNRVSAIIGYNQALAQLQRAVSNVAR